MTADYEQGHKTAFLNIISSIKNDISGPDLALLTLLPDAAHVGKSLKRSLCNWQLITGNERTNLLANIGPFHNISSGAVMEKNERIYSKI